MRTATRLAGSVVVALGVTVATVSPASAALPSCALSSLPAQAADTVDLIHQGGPFPYPRNDGVVFQNREGICPRRPRGTTTSARYRRPARRPAARAGSSPARFFIWRTGFCARPCHPEVLHIDPRRAPPYRPPKSKR